MVLAHTGKVASLVLAAALLMGTGPLAGAFPAGSQARAGAHAPLASTASAVRYQAADAWRTGGPAATTAGAAQSVTGMVTGLAGRGAMIVFAVNAPSDGAYHGTLHYANRQQTAKSLAVAVNGITAPALRLPPTGGASAWADQAGTLSLRAGLNTIAYTALNGGALSLGYLSLANGGQPAPRGATLPYLEYEAEAAQTNGKIIGPDRIFGDLAAEASGRRAVTLARPGQYVEFTLRAPANGMVLRYGLPDSAKGTGITAPLSLYVDGRFQRALSLTSKYTWLYGNYPFTNNPAGLGGHHFYDELHLLLPAMLPAGAKVRLQVARQDRAPSYTIDLADFERVPAPYARPAGYLSLAAFGADAGGRMNATAILQGAVNTAAAQHKGLYIPPGTYAVSRHILLNKVAIRGAGPWYTVLHGPGVGLYGYYPANSNQSYPPNPGGMRGPSSGVQVYDLAIQGETTDRQDNAQVNGFGGALGGGSIIQNVWIEHTKVGMWLDGPFSDLLVVGCRLRDLTADGLNLHDGVSNVMVEQSSIRNTGDDGLALWSDSDLDAYDVFRNNTVQIPYLANNIAMYGGQSNSVVNNVLTDTLTQGGGINIGNRDYGSAVVPLSGTILISGNTLIRTGQIDPNWGYGVGAIWFYAQTHDITARILVSNDELDDSTQEAIQFTGNNSVSNVFFDHVTIDKAGSFAIQIQSDVSASFSHVIARHLGVAGIYNCGNVFTITRGPGNAGWSKRVCDSLQSVAGG